MNPLGRISRILFHRGDALVAFEAVESMLPFSAQQVQHRPPAENTADNQIERHPPLTSAIIARKLKTARLSAAKWRRNRRHGSGQDHHRNTAALTLR